MALTKIAVAATFTAEPLADSLHFWNEKLLWNADVEFAPYSQVFQQLLDPNSLLSQNDDGINVLLIRPADWLRNSPQSDAADIAHEICERNARELASAIRAAVGRASIPYILCFCPPPGNSSESLLISVEETVTAELGDVPGVHVIGSREPIAAYGVHEWNDASGDKLAHIPYSPAYFAALGTAIARAVYALRNPQPKVIAVDCDETLWTGVCGEVGALGIELGAERLSFQNFLVQQHDSGKLIVLCSKNNPEDVEEVFERRPEMPLRRRHIAASRANWNSKSNSLRELAAELQLGLDSFVFIDDSPLECEQVKINCPEVLTLQLPGAPEKIPQFLKNLWIFDPRKQTEEDRQRTRLYQQNLEREVFRQHSPTLQSFLAGLELRVELEPIQAEQLARVAQLTQRTNQFNCTTLRRTEEQLQHDLRGGQFECLTVTVADRFGDYGLVGAVLYRVTSEAIAVENFLLSCRVLARGVEHRILRRLGEMALTRGLTRIDVSFIPSKKNLPAFNFLDAVARQFQRPAEQGLRFEIPAQVAAGISEDDVLRSGQAATSAVSENRPNPEASSVALSDVMQEIATELCDAESLLRHIAQRKTPASSIPVPGNRPLLTDVQRAITEAWRKALSVADISTDDDFFALGGDSLPAVQVLMELNQQFGISLSLQDFFDHRTMAGLGSVIERALSEKGTRVLQSEIQHSASAEVDAGSVLQRKVIPPRKQFSPCPPSFAQQSWWLLNEWAPQNPDLIACALRLRGSLDLGALDRTLEAIIGRHEILRTTYAAAGGGPVQVISQDRGPLHSRHVDLSSLKVREAELESERIIQEQVRQPFNFASDRMLRATLLRRSEQDHILILTMPHMASDALSREVLLRDLGAIYSAFVVGQPNPLPSLPLQYADFACWQRAGVDAGTFQKQLDYWKAELADAPATIELPRKRPDAGAHDFSGAQVSIVLPESTLDGLQALSRSQGVTLYMTLLAAFQALLHRYSGQSEIVVGTPEAGRSFPDLQNLIGCFVNILPVRTDLDGNPTFCELLAQVRETVLKARSNQDVPFEALVQEIEPGRDMRRAPLFQVIFALEKLPPAPELPGLEVEVREFDTRTALHDLSLYAAETPDGLRLKFEYKKDMFEPALIERMVKHLAHLLTAIVAEPNHKILSFPLLSDDERAELLFRWNEGQEFPVTACIQELFQEQARRAPHNTALRFEGQTLTYAELNARSNQMARRLIRMGVGPEVLVGLCTERSLELVVAILAILKAGGAYLPLEPRYPKERLGFMMKDAKPAVIITQAQWKTVLPDTDSPVLVLDTEWPEIERESAADFACPAQPENLAYVIYTSGSTGLPKGCQITHANVVRLFSATREWFGFDDHDVWTMFHSYAFDFSVWELWGALIYGGKLVVVPYLVSRSPEQFYRLLQTEGVTVLNQTPSSFRQIMDVDAQSDSASHPALRYVIFGGEALDMQSLKPWFERHGDSKPQLVNMYGITETTVHVTYRPLSPQDTAGGSVIGRPIPDLQLYILDENLQPAPIGVPGEMYVGGGGVARGYLNRTELNAQRFIPDVFRPGENRRLYKSGDQARRLPNGDIEYLGRIDQQVKIRGFRIELGEIESVLTQHPWVRDSIVLVDTDRNEKRLIAYLVTRDGQMPARAELQNFLKRSLPEYMIPAIFLKIDRIPLTSNGKLDRMALPAPDSSRVADQEGCVEPRTPLEQEVAEVWKAVLGLEQVSVTDNLFDVGGHSLLATRIAMLLRNRLGVSLPLSIVFENPSVEAIAAALFHLLLAQTEERRLLDEIEEIESLSDAEVQQLRAGAALEESSVGEPRL